MIHDAYRPWYVTKMFWDATPETGHGFVADPAKGSRHNRGCAVDLTLYDLEDRQAGRDGRRLRRVLDRGRTPTTPAARRASAGTATCSAGRWRTQGFTVYEVEWWHFDYKDWPKYPILNVTFEEIKEQASK